MTAEMIKNIIIGLTITLGVISPSLVIGKIAKSALEAIGRNPEAETGVRTTMILAIAFAEAIAIYVLVVTLILKFT
ncbi:MAG: ATP synthase F0 subunit C [Patescibacteria group bacterium]|nr:ATP synthase F0 subunit C [Patescibacteria group bacterium]